MRYRDLIAPERQPVTESAKRVTVWSGHTITVLHNPSRHAFEAFAAKHRAIRGLLSTNGNDLWIWDGAAAVHPNLIQELGLDRVDCVAYNDGRWSGPVYDRDGYYPAIERVTAYPRHRWDETDDELLRQLQDEKTGPEGPAEV